MKWIKEECLTTYSAFITLAEASQGYLANRSSKMNIRDFETGIKKCDIRIKHQDMKLIFDYLDVYKDGYINYDDWSQQIPDLSFPSFTPHFSPFSSK